MKSRNFDTRFALLVCALPWMPGMAAANDDQSREQVVCAETGFSRAAETRDLAAFLAYVDPDARFAGNSVARGKDAIAAAWRPFFEEGGPSIRWRAAITEVSSDGKLALSRGPYRSRRSGADGQPVESWGHFNSTWRKRADGSWLVLFDSGGDDGMTPTESEIALLNSDPDCP
jgi:ketosteroid isomerase-like protein